MGSMTDAELFDAAADVIDKYGWVQDEYGSEELGFCTMGAIFQATQTQDRSFLRIDQRSFSRIFSILGRATNSNAIGCGDDFDIPAWNDTPGRTKEEVTTALRKAAKIAAGVEE